MKNSIWRNRANTILGLMVAILPFVEGFPGWLENIIFLSLGLLITLFAITGIKDKKNNTSTSSEIKNTFMDEVVTEDKSEDYTSPPVYTENESQDGESDNINR